MPERRELDNVPTLTSKVELSGVKVHKLQPGEIDDVMTFDHHVIDLNYAHVTHHTGVNSDKRKPVLIKPNSCAFFPKGTDLSLAVNNTLAGCLLEISDELMSNWCEEGEVDPQTQLRHINYEMDHVASGLGRLVIDHLDTVNTNNISRNDYLTMEALCLGIGARFVARMAVDDGDIHEEVSEWNRRADDKKIKASMDYAEEHLADPQLSVHKMAQAACLSACHFGSIFKARTGETPYNYILRRRSERARVLIATTDMPLAQISMDMGFSNQAHMSTMLKRQFGMTPKQFRSA